MWCAHNEIEARWSYTKAWDMMWINRTEVPLEQQLSYPDFSPASSDEPKDSVNLNQEYEDTIKSSVNSDAEII